MLNFLVCSRFLVIRASMLCLAVMAAGINFSASQAQTTNGPFFDDAESFPDDDDAIEFAMTEPPDSTIDSQLINGSEVPDTVATIVRIGIQVSPVNIKRCTATLIGSRTLLTAAHCLRKANGEMSTAVRLTIGGRAAAGRCTWLEAFANTPAKDWALCHLNREVRNLLFERVDMAWRPTAGNPIVLTGYGCTQDGRSDGKLRYGFHKIASSVPATTWGSAGFVGTKALAGAPQLCSGDSGGPVIRIVGEPPEQGSWSSCRRQIATNTAVVATGSLFSPLIEARELFDEWTEATEEIICGYNSDGRDSNCHC